MLVQNIFRLVCLCCCVSLFSACGGSPVQSQVVNTETPNVVAGLSSTNYLLSPGDTINISVFGEPDLAQEIVLNTSGSFNYPYLGMLSVLNKTLLEVQELITDGLSQGYLINPKVSVTMDSFREVYVGGEVSLGGSFPFQPGLSVGKAIVLAGGFTERASRGGIYVVSEGAKNSKPVKVSLDYILKPGDVITVQRRFF